MVKESSSFTGKMVDQDFIVVSATSTELHKVRSRLNALRSALFAVLFLSFLVNFAHLEKAAKR